MPFANKAQLVFRHGESTGTIELTRVDIPDLTVNTKVSLQGILQSTWNAFAPVTFPNRVGRLGS